MMLIRPYLATPSSLVSSGRPSRSSRPPDASQQTTRARGKACCHVVHMDVTYPARSQVCDGMLRGSSRDCVDCSRNFASGLRLDKAWHPNHWACGYPSLAGRSRLQPGGNIRRPAHQVAAVPIICPFQMAACWLALRVRPVWAANHSVVRDLIKNGSWTLDDAVDFPWSIRARQWLLRELGGDGRIFRSFLFFLTLLPLMSGLKPRQGSIPPAN